MKKITLDGQTYVLESDIPEPKEITIEKEVFKDCAHEEIDYEPFSIAEEMKIHKILSGLLYELKGGFLGEWLALKSENIKVIDKGNVCMVIAKSPRAKVLLRRYTDKEDHVNGVKIPELNYEKDKGRSTMSVEYLKKFLPLFINNAMYDKVAFKVSQDYPLSLENEDFEVILAPRIDDEA